MKRREFCSNMVLAAGVGGVLAVSQTPTVAQVQGAATADVALIYELQAAFHRAKTTQDLNLMLSLWDPAGTLKIVGDPKSPYVGADQLRGFWAGSGSFKNKRFSLVPSYKTRIEVNGSQGRLYFECHDVGDYEQPTRTIVADTFLSGTVRKMPSQWVFLTMTAGPSNPLSLEHYFD